ncbi:MAG: RidA family protein [Hyphomicrobiales bacterium]|uniref:RidA family protein n=1 Tax=Rhabdaerophilum calidifontis TaxID=2604328 RepID=UPI00123B38BB|nr:RidA family protein [Rhabdaerophilum calidifontis]MCA1953197.1 RidA family protein [Hyphomicrobiales bacterium]MCA2000000.1 RidA family protein [Hyphomicrobiales bacterium]
MSPIETRLAELGLSLPVPVAPVANYVPYRISGTLLVLSGQICIGPDGALAPRHKGKLGGAVSPEDGAEAAKFCAINLLAQARAALGGDLTRLKSCLRLGGFIAATPDFTALPQVMNGASDLMVAAMGDAGRHARTTIGVPVLPLDCAVEVDGLFEIAG